MIGHENIQSPNRNGHIKNQNVGPKLEQAVMSNDQSNSKTKFIDKKELSPAIHVL